MRRIVGLSLPKLSPRAETLMKNFEFSMKDLKSSIRAAYSTGVLPAIFFSLDEEERL